MEARTSRRDVRRFVGWTLVVCLTIAAATASVALLSGSFDDTDWRVIGTSLAFAFYSAVSASGASLRLRGGEYEWALGTATVVLATCSFVLFLPALWTDADSDTLWRAVGASGIAALAGSHACLVVGARRAADSSAVTTLATASIVLGAFDSAVLILGVVGVIDDIDEGAVELLGVLLIALLLCTALQPIVRKLQQPATRSAPRDPAAALAEQVLDRADRIEQLTADPSRTPEIRREVQRLRESARRYAS